MPLGLNFGSGLARALIAQQCSASSCLKHRQWKEIFQITTGYRSLCKPSYRRCRAGRKVHERASKNTQMISRRTSRFTGHKQNDRFADQRNLVAVVAVKVYNQTKSSPADHDLQVTKTRTSKRAHTDTAQSSSFRSPAAGIIRNHLIVIPCQPQRKSSNRSPRLHLAHWNIRSLNKKAVPVCDLIISERIDILAITETWLPAEYKSDTTLAEIGNTLKDFDSVHLPRKTSRSGGGVSVFLKRGLAVKENPSNPFYSMEYMDLSITTSNSSLQLVTVYRPPPSKENKLTPRMFFDEFATLLENLALNPGNLIITGDFNFHVDDTNDRDAVRFLDLLEATGYQQKVVGATHKHGHTLDLMIVRQEASLLVGVPNVTLHPRNISDHSSIMCTLDLPKPPTTKQTVQCRDLRRIDMDLWSNDTLLYCPLQ